MTRAELTPEQIDKACREAKYWVNEGGALGLYCRALLQTRRQLERAQALIVSNIDPLDMRKEFDATYEAAHHAQTAMKEKK